MQQQAVEYIKNATITGNVTNDPRMGEGGWVSFTIAHTPRHLNQILGLGKMVTQSSMHLQLIVHEMGGSRKTSSIPSIKGIE